MASSGCSSGCTTGPHRFWGDCVRSKDILIADVTARKFNHGINRQLKDYSAAREAGLQPETVFKKDVDAAWRKTEALGVPFRADEVA